MQLTWDDIVLHTIREFEAQVRYGWDDTWRTVGVMREWAAADAIAMTAARDFEGGRQPPGASWSSIARPLLHLVNHVNDLPT